MCISFLAQEIDALLGRLNFDSSEIAEGQRTPIVAAHLTQYFEKSGNSLSKFLRVRRGDITQLSKGQDSECFPNLLVQRINCGEELRASPEAIKNARNRQINVYDWRVSVACISDNFLNVACKPMLAEEFLVKPEFVPACMFLFSEPAMNLAITPVVKLDRASVAPSMTLPFVYALIPKIKERFVTLLPPGI